MYTPWFSSTDETAQLVLKTGQQDYLDFIEFTSQTDSNRKTTAWQTAMLISFADLLIASGTKIKKSVAPKLRPSFQTR